jgi:hypothetical protein
MHTNRSRLGLLCLERLGCRVEILHVFPNAFIVDDIDFLHDAGREDAEVTADVLLADLGVGADDVVVADDSVLDLSLGLDGVAVPHLRVHHVGLYAEGVVAADPHHVVLLRNRLEHYHCPLLDHVVVSEDHFEVLVLFLADDGAGRVDDAALAEDDVADDLVEAQVYYVVALRHLDS